MASMTDKMKEFLANQNQANNNKTSFDISESAKEVNEKLSDIHALFVNTDDEVTDLSDNVFDLTNIVKMVAVEIDDYGEIMCHSLLSMQASLQTLLNSHEFAMMSSIESTLERGMTRLIRNSNDMLRMEKSEAKANRDARKLTTQAKTNVLVSKKKELTSNKPEPGKQGIDSKMIADQMKQGLMTALNPVTLVKTFFSFILPKLIVLGLLLYGFIVGFLGGDVYDFVCAMGAVVIGLFVAFIAFQISKQLILLGIQIACEWIKVALAAQPAAIAIVAIGIILVAFLAVAALIAVTIIAAVLGIVVAMYVLTKAMKAMVTSMIEGIMGVFQEQLVKTESMIKETMTIISTVIPLLTEKMLEMTNTLSVGLNKVIGNLASSFLVMEQTMDGLASEMSKIFNGLAAAIISSALFKSVEKAKAEGEDFTARLSPLHDTVRSIEKLLREVVKGVRNNRTKIARSTYNSNSSNTYNGGDVYNTARVSDGMKSVGETAVLGRPSDYVTNDKLDELKTSLTTALAEVVAAIKNIQINVPEQKSSGPWSLFG